MNNPIDVLGVHPGGALPSRQDPRNYQVGSTELPLPVEAFDWNIGYDVEKDVSAILGQPFKLSRKNQGPSGSCGGQGMSAYGQALAAAHLGDTSERSAKFPYAQVFVPGGGSAFDALANVYRKQGFGLESLTPSYENGQPPSEAFMERVGDITAAARGTAAKESIMLAYAYVNPTIDEVALALSVCKGMSILLRGSNNGTWLSTDPIPPSPEEFAAGAWSPQNPRGVWAHYMYAIGAEMRNGKKVIKVLQSWGNAVPNDQIQYLSEDYFNTPGAIFEAGVLIYNPKPLTPPQHTFTHDLKEGMSDQGTYGDITALQALLAYDGEFNVAPTGYYGPITAKAVLAFQLKHAVASVAILDELAGSVVGPATRAALNALV